jgi:hypothetical protein
MLSALVETIGALAVLASIAAKIALLSQHHKQRRQ